jgi:uncharacterized protein YecT (DUF1311 family)
MNKILLTSLLCSILSLSGCNKIFDKSVKCNDETVQKLVINDFNKKLLDSADQSIKALIKEENITIDMGRLRSTLNQIKFQVSDIRTNNSDPNSNKEYCSTLFSIEIPSKIIKDADAARTLYNENNVSQIAVLSDIVSEQGQFKKEFDYSVQPTDDGDKVLINLENPESLIYFVRDVAISSLIKSARENAIALAEQERQKTVEAEQAAQQEYTNVLLQEAENRLNIANTNLNLVWNATTKDIRSQLLDEQRLWLKKRELECKLESSSYESPEIQRLNCEANMTDYRIEELRRKIYYLE